MSDENREFKRTMEAHELERILSDIEARRLWNGCDATGGRERREEILAAEISRLRAQSGWLPIDEATEEDKRSHPLSHPLPLIWPSLTTERWARGWWYGGNWHTGDGFRGCSSDPGPTHFFRLPEGPKPAKEPDNAE